MFNKAIIAPKSPLNQTNLFVGQELITSKWNKSKFLGELRQGGCIKMGITTWIPQAHKKWKAENKAAFACSRVYLANHGQKGSPTLGAIKKKNQQTKK